MRESALAARPRRRFVRTTDTAHDEPVFPNLLHDVQPDGPNQVWVADLTYLRLEREFAYLAVILDAWSRKVVGYAVGHVLDVRLPLAALEAALESRRPPPGLLHHWGREVQYALWRYRERLAEAGLRGSMSRTGNPYDNAAGGELHENPETRGGLPARLGHGAGRDRPAPLLPGGGLQPQTSPLVPGLSASGGVRGPTCADRRGYLRGFTSPLLTYVHRSPRTSPNRLLFQDSRLRLGRTPSPPLFESS